MTETCETEARMIGQMLLGQAWIYVTNERYTILAQWLRENIKTRTINVLSNANENSLSKT